MTAPMHDADGTSERRDLAARLSLGGRALPLPFLRPQQGRAPGRACLALGEHATLKWLLAQFRKPCAWNPVNPARKPQKYGRKCGAYLMDIGRTSPPDLPPSMFGLTLIEGGKDEQLPAEPSRETRRRRIGGD